MKKNLTVLVISIICASFSFHTNAQNCNIAAPKSCFIKSTNNTQILDRNNTNCQNRGTLIILNQEQADYTNEKQGTNFSITGTDVSQLQSFLQNHPYTRTIINSNKHCTQRSFKDGKYGDCTKNVYAEFLKKSCQTQKASTIKTLTITVKDKEFKDYIENAQINGKVVITTDKNGQGVVETEDDKNIIVEFPGYKPFTITPPYNDNTITVLLEGSEDTVTINDKRNTESEETNNSSNEKTQTNPVQTTEKTTNITNIQWDENLLRPKFQTGANWTNREYKGDASDINYWLRKFSGKITGFLSAIAVLIIAYNGFLLTVAGSDDDSLSKAKNAITWALIGLVGLNFVYIIVKTVISLAY